MASTVNILRKEERGGVGELEIDQLNLDFWKSTRTNNPTTFYKHLEDKNKNNVPKISSKPSNFLVHHGNRSCGQRSNRRFMYSDFSSGFGSVSVTSYVMEMLSLFKILITFRGAVVSLLIRVGI